MKYNLRAIRKLILEAYDEQELTVFCHDYFHEVIEYFGTGTGKSEKAFQLVTYCDRREQLRVLVDRIKAERPEKYEKYRARLESEEEAPSVLEEIQAETSEYADVLEPMGQIESRRKCATAATESTQESDHPLAGSPQEIKRWFLADLSSDEQIFVVTAALFSGLERQELMAIYGDVLRALQPVEPGADEGGKHA
jgi:hypothetical protein